MFDNDRRIGKFYISTELIEFNPEIVKKIMSRMIVVRAELLYHTFSIEYHAISSLFEPVNIGECTPEYTLIYNDNDVLEVRRFNYA
jgi:hypothetical protein